MSSASCLVDALSSHLGYVAFHSDTADHRATSATLGSSPSPAVWYLGVPQQDPLEFLVECSVSAASVDCTTPAVRRLFGDGCIVVSLRCSTSPMDADAFVFPAVPPFADAVARHASRLERWKAATILLTFSSSSNSPAAAETGVSPPVSLGIPAAFAQRDTTPRHATSDAAARRGGYGQADLTPTGGNFGFSREGSVVGAPNGVPTGGMIMGPRSGVFNNPTGGLFGATDPATLGLARFDPPFPFGPNGSAGGGHAPGLFPGEPNPDHLRPFNNDALPPFGGNRGGIARNRFGGGSGFFA